MDVLKVTETKIKITLSREDAESFGLDNGAVDYNDIDSRAKIWQVLDEVKARWGFDPAGEKLLVQYYPSREGGAEIFVAKLGRIAKREQRHLSGAEEVTVLDEEVSLFCFSSFSDLTSACRVISGMRSLIDSGIYYTEDGYFLTVRARGGSRHGELCETSVLGEYAKRVNPSYRFYLYEHGSAIRDTGAVELISSLG